MKTLVITSEMNFIHDETYQGLIVGAYLHDESKGVLGDKGRLTANFKFQNTPCVVTVYPLELFEDILNQFETDEIDFETTYVKFFHIKEGA